MYMSNENGIFSGYTRIPPSTGYVSVEYKIQALLTFQFLVTMNLSFLLLLWIRGVFTFRERNAIACWIRNGLYS